MPTGYYNPRLGIGSPAGTSTPTYQQNGQLDEAAMRGGGVGPGYVAGETAMAPAPTYRNGNTFAGTGSTSNPGGGNVPMSDAAYRLISNNGTQAIPTDRDVLGGGKFGVRGWMNDHPVGVMAAFIAAAAGGAALMPEAAGAGAGAAEGGAVGWGGAGTGGFEGMASLPNMSAVGGGNAGALASGGGISGGAGMGAGGYGSSALAGGGGGLGSLSTSDYMNLGSQLLGGGGGGGGAGAGGGGGQMMPQGMFGSQARMPNVPQQAPQSQLPILPSMQPQLQAVGRKPYNFRGTTVWI